MGEDSGTIIGVVVRVVGGTQTERLHENGLAGGLYIVAIRIIPAT